MVSNIIFPPVVCHEREYKMGRKDKMPPLYFEKTPVTFYDGYDKMKAVPAIVVWGNIISK